MSLFFLSLAIVSEVMGTTCMKLSMGFTRLLPSIFMFVFYIISLCSLTFALKKIEVSTAYAIWSGLGTALISVIGILWFQELVSTSKMVSLGLVIAGVIGLNLSGGNH
jgi:small multidrug resistance pump